MKKYACFFCACIIRIENRNYFVEDFFFQFKPLFFEKSQLENSIFLQQQRFILFLPSLSLTLSCEKIEWEETV
jgi:hypothetical protein